MEGSVPSRNNRVHVETALIFITPAARHATDGRHLRRILWQKKINAVKPVHITTISLGFALIQRQRIEQISRIMGIHVTVGRVGRISHAKRRFEGLETGYANRRNN